MVTDPRTLAEEAKARAENAMGVAMKRANTPDKDWAAETKAVMAHHLAPLTETPEREG